MSRHGSDVVRVDHKSGQVQELEGWVPDYKMAPKEQSITQAQYRLDCMNGADHPMSIECYQYQLITVHVASMDTATAAEDYGYGSRRFNKLEAEFIQSVMKKPEVEWAVDNSFDGIYIQRFEDPSAFGTRFRFAVYMKDEQITFWKLKHAGR